MNFLQLFSVFATTVAPFTKDTLRFISHHVGKLFRNRIETYVGRLLFEVIRNCRRRMNELRLKSCVPNDIDFFRSKSIEFENYVHGLSVTEEGCLRLLFEFEQYYLVSSLKHESQLIQCKFPLHPEHQQSFVEFHEALNNILLLTCDDEDPQSSLEYLRAGFDDLAFTYYQQRTQAMTIVIIRLSNSLQDSYQKEVTLLLNMIQSKSIESDEELLKIFHSYDKLIVQQNNQNFSLFFYFIVLLIVLMLGIFGFILFHSYQFTDHSTVLCVDKLDRRGFFGPLRR